MFEKILVANRGEIACRVIRTAKKLGVLTVAVYSDADKNSLHVKMADEAIHIGASPANESYLQGGKILQAAKRSAAEAIHPGYGFLSENAEFCENCARENFVFIGPPANSIAAMGSKSAAKNIMQKAGVPLIPGYHGEDQTPDYLKSVADAMGYPVLLKAAAGGGGRGMRPVYESEQFLAALNDAKRESMSSFGDDQMLIEKYLTRPRHVEIQIFCDHSGNGIYLYDRDCSIQRRHQKVVEEAPAPGLPEKVRSAMGETALSAAQAIDYVGAGTVEFLVDKNSAGEYLFYFMEMNTRLQVEHPVTEMVTGQDLVEWQLRIACGQNLPLKQQNVEVSGHAFEARIYAEDPQQNFCPSTGTLIHLRPPEQDAHIRIDTGVVEGDEVSPFYDPMISKLITWDTDREKARKRLIKALGEYQIAGVTTNIRILNKILSSRAFKNADIDTRFIEAHEEEIYQENDKQSSLFVILAFLYFLLRRKQRQLGEYLEVEFNSPWISADKWRLNHRCIERTSITVDKRSYAIEAEEFLSGNLAYYEIVFDDKKHKVSGQLYNTSLSADIDGYCLTVDVVDNNHRSSTLLTRRGGVEFQLDLPDFGQDDTQHHPNGCLAPMNARVLEVLVSETQSVAKGDALVVMEAMKMEHTITASFPATVGDIFVKQGELVGSGVELMILNKSDET